MALETGEERKNAPCCQCAGLGIVGRGSGTNVNDGFTEDTLQLDAVAVQFQTGLAGNHHFRLVHAGGGDANCHRYVDIVGELADSFPGVAAEQLLRLRFGQQTASMGAPLRA